MLVFSGYLWYKFVYIPLHLIHAHLIFDESIDWNNDVETLLRTNTLFGFAISQKRFVKHYNHYKRAIDSLMDRRDSLTVRDFIDLHTYFKYSIFPYLWVFCLVLILGSISIVLFVINIFPPDNLTTDPIKIIQFRVHYILFLLSLASISGSSVFLLYRFLRGRRIFKPFR